MVDVQPLTEQEQAIVDRIARGTTTETDARYVHRVILDQHQLLAGTRALAQAGLSAWLDHDLATIRDKLQKLAVME